MPFAILAAPAHRPANAATRPPPGYGATPARSHLTEGHSRAMDDIADMPETGAAEPPAIQRKTARAAMIERRRRRKPAPSLKVSRENGAIAVEVDHPDRALGAMELMEALGTADPDFCDGLLSQVVRAGIKGGEPDAREANFLLSVARAAEPRDELEAMLAAQMGGSIWRR